MAVAVEVFRVIRAAMNFGEFYARRAGVVVVLGVVDEVLPGEQTALGPARALTFADQAILVVVVHAK